MLQNLLTITTKKTWKQPKIISIPSINIQLPIHQTKMSRSNSSRLNYEELLKNEASNVSYVRLAVKNIESKILVPIRPKKVNNKIFENWKLYNDHRGCHQKDIAAAGAIYSANSLYI